MGSTNTIVAECSNNVFHLQFNNNQVHAYMDGNEFSQSVTLNKFNAQFSTNTVPVQFTKNTVDSAVMATDFTGASLVNSNFFCHILENNSFAPRLVYWDNGTTKFVQAASITA